MTALLVALGAAVGAPLRYLTDRWARARFGNDFPWGTLTVNVTGSFLLGVLTGAVSTGALPDWLPPLVGTGFCGALTTYSTFGHETVHLLTGGARRRALLNVVGNTAAGLAAAALGVVLGGLAG